MYVERSYSASQRASPKAVEAVAQTVIATLHNSC